MTFADDLRRVLSNPKPLYFVAGAGDAAVERLREAPTLLAEAGAKLNAAAADMPNRLAGARERLSGIELDINLPKLDPKSLRDSIANPDLRGLRERAQTVALTQFGKALEAAGRAVEAYDELAERGKGVAERLGVADALRGASRFTEQVTVVRVEQVTDESDVDDAEFGFAPTPAAEATATPDEPVAEPSAAATSKPKAPRRTASSSASSTPAAGTRKRATAKPAADGKPAARGTSKPGGGKGGTRGGGKPNSP
jgi:hypothetical protein